MAPHLNSENYDMQTPLFLPRMAFWFQSGWTLVWRLKQIRATNSAWDSFVFLCVFNSFISAADTERKKRSLYLGYLETMCMSGKTRSTR